MLLLDAIKGDLLNEERLLARETKHAKKLANVMQVQRQERVTTGESQGPPRRRPATQNGSRPQPVGTAKKLAILNDHAQRKLGALSKIEPIKPCQRVCQMMMPQPLMGKFSWQH